VVEVDYPAWFRYHGGSRRGRASIPNGKGFPMTLTKLDREKLVIVVDRREADDLAALMHALEVDCGEPTTDPESGDALVPLGARMDAAELDRADALVAEFNKMRSTRAAF
jgi:hypothetical protein